MPAEWTEPRDWEVDELVTAAHLNEQLRDNMEYLLSPNHQRIIRDNSGDYSITSVTSFQDIDSTNLTIDLETHGGPVWVYLLGSAASIGVTEDIAFDITIDGTRLGAAYTWGLQHYVAPGTSGLGEVGVGLGVMLTGLAAGSYVLRPQWRTGSGETVVLRAATAETPLIFGAIEL